MGRAARFWHFDLDTAVPDDGSLPIGADLPERPIVVRDGDDNLYVLDVAEPQVGPGGSSSAGVGGASSAAPPSGSVDENCRCVAAGAPRGRGLAHGALFALGLALAFRRRR